MYYYIIYTCPVSIFLWYIHNVFDVNHIFIIYILFRYEYIRYIYIYIYVYLYTILYLYSCTVLSDYEINDA